MRFQNVIGQVPVKEHLIQTVRSERISHAQMFIGREGYGGLPLALAYAQYVLCKDRLEEDACGDCSSCRKMAKHIHPDVHFSYPVVSGKGGVPIAADYIAEWREILDKAPYSDYVNWLAAISNDNKQGNITVRECHEIIRKLSLKSFEGDYKVLIMWLPEYLGNAGNTLLKLIEEPPERTLFLFVAADESKLLNTILSRVQIVRIPPTPAEHLIEGLKAKYDIDDQTAARIANLAEGDFLQACRVFESGGNALMEDFRQWMRICFTNNGADVVWWVIDMARTGRERQKNFIRFAVTIFRECMLLNSEAEQITTLYGDDLDWTRDKFAPFVSMNNFADLVDLFDKSHFYVERNANPKLVFFNLTVDTGRLLKAR